MLTATQAALPAVQEQYGVAQCGAAPMKQAPKGRGRGGGGEGGICAMPTVRVPNNKQSALAPAIHWVALESPAPNPHDSPGPHCPPARVLPGRRCQRHACRRRRRRARLRSRPETPWLGLCACCLLPLLQLALELSRFQQARLLTAHGWWWCCCCQALWRRFRGWGQLALLPLLVPPRRAAA